MTQADIIHKKERRKKKKDNSQGNLESLCHRAQNNCLCHL